MAAGFYAFAKLPVADFADIDVPVITITVTYAGATPNQMEAEITRKVEDAIAGVNGVQHITSTVTQGLSSTAIEFGLDDDIPLALADVRDAVGSHSQHAAAGHSRPDNYPLYAGRLAGRYLRD